MRAVIIAAMLCVSSPVQASSLLKAAKSYVGLHERSHNATLRRAIGANPARVPWCGYFMGAVAKKAGIKPPAGYPRAISWRTAGRPVPIKAAKAGDVVVMRNHVTIYSRRAGAKICGIGGNQSNAVRETCYSAAKVVAVRRVN